MEATYFKMPFRSHQFNNNQKVFVLQSTGNQAAYCYGRYRGNGRWIKAWVNWCGLHKAFPEFKKIKIDNKCHIARNIMSWGAVVDFTC